MNIDLWEGPSEVDYNHVERLLGRPPQGRFVVVARRISTGIPSVIACWPIIEERLPMPTLFWLCDPPISLAVSRLESGGIIKEIRESLDLDLVEYGHRTYSSIRDGLIPDDYLGPRPSGGVGGTRSGFKCLHAHVGWHIVSKVDAPTLYVLEHHPQSLDLSDVRVLGMPAGLGCVSDLHVDALS
ncbi:DUF501 domain-containing protein [Acidithrix ferrooxidans]|uniref:DUF501 domain-containing protein n=1 Tax=Acidithrix ferrooxidans TaxID=1280514 RepID=A0A0D8HI83_9ACTN|nr:DUF501 domain-containing protein [Acidithrix ferrooxidans]KJF17695.1 hypothetical protein AXFE_14030 [Acidithrix ferrooxidans]